MKIRALRDKALKPSHIEDILEDIKTSYEDVTDVQWQQEEIDGNVPWETYYADNKGIAKSHVKEKTKKLWNTYGYAIDHVIWFISIDKWEADGIGGWNLGKLYNNYSVQIVLADQTGDWEMKTTQMEIIHAMDEFAPVELGQNLNKMKPVDGEYLDWDDDRVHGEHPKYGQKQDDGTYYTDYQYDDLIDEFSTVISDIYTQRRRKEYKKTISLLEKIIRLYRKLLKYNQKPTPAPLQGNHNQHDHN